MNIIWLSALKQIVDGYVQRRLAFSPRKLAALDALKQSLLHQAFSVAL